MSVIPLAAGVALVLFILLEVFEALVLPRRVTPPFRFTRLYYRAGWRVWTAAARLLRATRRRQTFLSAFGPLSLVILFGIWAAGLVGGFGLVQYALAPDRGLPDALYLSGTTFTTLGYGDVTPTGAAARALAVTEAATGFGYFADVVTLPWSVKAARERKARGL